MPRAIVVTHLEAARAGFEEMTELCRRTFGGDDPDAVLPLYLPLPARGPGRARPGHRADRPAVPAGLRLLLGRTEGDPTTDDQAPAAVEEARDRLIEGIIAESEDETLMDRYLGGEEIDIKTLIDDLEQAVARGTFHPVLAAAPAADGARQGLGTLELLELVTGGFPTPLEREAPAVTTPQGAARPRAGLRPGRPAGRRGGQDLLRPVRRPDLAGPRLLRHAAARRDGARLRARPGGPRARGPRRGRADRRAVRAVRQAAAPAVARRIAGDLACVAKLTRAETGDTLSAKDDPLLMEPWQMPDPLLPVAIEAHSKADEDKLSLGLARLVAEDPTMRLEQNPDTHQVVLWCLGEAHVDVALERLRGRYGVQVDAVPYKVSLRETFGEQAAGRGRHVKQSGGHGQFAICEIEVEPLPGGSGIEFVDKVVGGAVPRQFIPSVEKGVRAQAAQRRRRRIPAGRRARHAAGRQGALGGLLRRRVPDGGRARAARGRRGRAASTCWSRSSRCGCWSPTTTSAPVMSDLSGRRGRVVGTEQTGGGPHPVRAEVPGDRDRPVRGRPAVAVARHRPVQPLVRPARADAAAGRGRGCAKRRGTGA